jgi:hypothetical protein
LPRFVVIAQPTSRLDRRLSRYRGLRQRICQHAVRRQSGLKEATMAIRDDIIPLYRQRDWRGCHRVLDASSPGDDKDERRSHAHWRAAVFEGEGRYREALDFLQAHRNDFSCKTSVHHERARIFTQMGDSKQAIDALKAAPFGEELEQFPGLVREAAYFYCLLLAEEGRDVPQKLLEIIPHDFRYINIRGQRDTKARITDTIAKNRAPRSRGLLA